MQRKFKLEFKYGAKVILTSNVNLEDRLVNGLVGMVMTFKCIGIDVNVIYKKFTDVNTGKVTMQYDNLARQNDWVPIGKVEACFLIKKNKTHSCIKLSQIPTYAIVVMRCA